VGSIPTVSTFQDDLDMADERPSRVLRRYFESLSRAGIDEAVTLWHPEIEWRAIQGAADDVGVIRGADAMRGYCTEWLETMADLRGDVAEIAYEDDERVAALIHNSGTGRVSGVPAAGSYYVACLVRDGRIVTGREYATREEALAAVEGMW
jgi:ketosteroid isomerase-like protein